MQANVAQLSSGQAVNTISGYVSNEVNTSNCQYNQGNTFEAETFQSKKHSADIVQSMSTHQTINKSIPFSCFCLKPSQYIKRSKSSSKHTLEVLVRDTQHRNRTRHIKTTHKIWTKYSDHEGNRLTKGERLACFTVTHRYQTAAQKLVLGALWRIILHRRLWRSFCEE